MIGRGKNLKLLKFRCELGYAKYIAHSYYRNFKCDVESFKYITLHHVIHTPVTLYSDQWRINKVIFKFSECELEM